MEKNLVAKLVTFSIMTRVVIVVSGDDEVDEEKAIRAARANIMAEPHTYIIGDNVSEIEPDEECPYGEIEFDKKYEDLVRIKITGGYGENVGKEYDAKITPDTGLAFVNGVDAGVYDKNKYKLL